MADTERQAMHTTRAIDGQRRPLILLGGLLFAAVAAALGMWWHGSRSEEAVVPDFWAAIEPSGAEAFYPATFDELGGGAEYWITGKVVAAKITPDLQSVVVVAVDEAVTPADFGAGQQLEIKIGELTWSPNPSQIAELEGAVPVGEQYLLGVTRVGAEPNADMRLATSRAAFRLSADKITPILDPGSNAEWLAGQAVNSATAATSRIRVGRAECGAKASCVIGIDYEGNKILGSWPTP